MATLKDYSNNQNERNTGWVDKNKDLCIYIEKEYKDMAQ